MIQTIAVVNMKGGVGKSTAVAALSEILASKAKSRVLAVDLDPQANSSWVLAGVDRWSESRKAGRTVDAFFEDVLWQRGLPKVPDFITENVSDVKLKSQIDLLITTPEFRYTEREAIEKLVEEGCRLRDVRQRIANAVRRIREQVDQRYEYMIVDCPPGISYFAEAALLIADVVVVPTIPDFMSQFGLETFIRRVLTPLAAPPLLQRPPLEPGRLCVLLSKFDNGMELHRTESVNIRDSGRGRYVCFQEAVPQDQDVARAAEFSDEKRTLELKYGRALPAFRAAADYIARELGE
ncbi:MAG: ParA family protein [Pseudomonadota bacterium]